MIRENQFARVREASAADMLASLGIGPDGLTHAERDIFFADALERAGASLARSSAALRNTPPEPLHKEDIR
jgi:hypothetical protein